jgi:carboxypeptidase D
MRFSTYVSALAVAIGVVSAAGHSGRSLKHVGLQDKARPQARKQPLPPKSSFNRRDTSQYLTNSTTSKSSYRKNS